MLFTVNTVDCSFNFFSLKKLSLRQYSSLIIGKIQEIIKKIYKKKENVYYSYTFNRQYFLKIIILNNK